MAPEIPSPDSSLSSGQHFTNASVVIIGAGMGGICAAIDLIKRNDCRDFVILERSSGVGGTWQVDDIPDDEYANTYPGCSVDLRSIVYSYSFAPNSEWTRDFPGQKEILSYLTRVAQEYGLYEHIRFCSTAESATWDDELKQWNTRVKVAQGSRDAETTSDYTISSDFLVSAVGQLSQPNWPEIKGLDTFKGKTMHSATWDWAYDLKDKRIAVIGSGCSAVQIVPELAKVAEKVTVFQRTPHWIFPRGNHEISNLWKGLYRYFPACQRYWRRHYVDQGESEFVLSNFPESEANKRAQKKALEHMHGQLPGQPELWEKLTPQYPVGSKRLVVTNLFFPALNLPNVELEVRPIHSISDNAVRVTGSEGQPESIDSHYDLIVFATGFRSTDFLSPMKIYGRNGRALHDIWKDGAQAYLGACAEDMPNFGIIMGPNTGLLHNSFLLIIEAQSRYINGLIKPVLQARRGRGALSLTPRSRKVQEYNAMLQDRLKDFGVNGSLCDNWYKTSSGLVTNLWPGLVLEFQKLVEQVDYRDYDAEGPSQHIVQTRPVYKVGRVAEEGGFVENLSLAKVVLLGASAIAGGLLTRRLIKGST